MRSSGGVSRRRQEIPDQREKTLNVFRQGARADARLRRPGSDLFRKLLGPMSWDWGLGEALCHKAGIGIFNFERTLS